jgi:putative heme-binding domain-containing protein
VLFFSAEKSLCIKCHRLDDRGEKIGPELTGVGGRFSRIYIVESILEPSRTIAPSFETISVVTVDGRTITGVRTAETETTLTLADNEGKQHAIQKTDIEEREIRPTSTMVEGIEKKLSIEQFVDLVSFLVSRKEQPPVGNALRGVPP